MSAPSYPQAWQRSLVVLTGTVVAAAVVAAAYFAQDVLIPIALAVYLAFILTPLVRLCERLRLGRVSSVIVVVLLISLLLTACGMVVSTQLNSLSDELPNYRANIIERIRAVRKWGDTGRMGDLMKAIGREINSPDPELPGVPEEEVQKEPVLVREQPVGPPWLAHLSNWGGLTVSFSAMILLAMILLIFILLKREDLRNRFLWLFGRHKLSSTTKAVEDAASRLSRFLLTQAIVNASFGLIFGIGLYLIGVPYALLWGFLGGLLRYLPYVGPWLGALFPIALTLAMSDTWTPPLLVVGFVLLLELINNNVVEPLLYGRSIGVSEVALLVGAAFWTWLWGPIGLVLSPPLMVVLVVMGKHVPSLEFLAILLGDEPIFDPPVVYFQRLLARDLDEATRIVLDRLDKPNPERIYDELLLPALTSARLAVEQKTINPQDEEFISRAVEEMLDELGESDSLITEHPAAEGDTDVCPVTRVRLLCCPARDGADRVADRMLTQLLPRSAWEISVIGEGKLAGELLDDLDQFHPTVICVGSASPGTLARTRYLCKRLRARFPQTKIVVGRWASELSGAAEEQILAAGADIVGDSLLETCNELNSLYPVLMQQQRSTELHGRQVNESAVADIAFAGVSDSFYADDDGGLPPEEASDSHPPAAASA